MKAKKQVTPKEEYVNEIVATSKLWFSYLKAMFISFLMLVGYSFKLVFYSCIYKGFVIFVVRPIKKWFFQLIDWIKHW